MVTGRATLLARKARQVSAQVPRSCCHQEMSQLDVNAVQRAIALAVVIFLVQRVVSCTAVCRAFGDILFRLVAFSQQFPCCNCSCRMHSTCNSASLAAFAAAGALRMEH